MACMICGTTDQPIYVHGHTQCGRCGSLQEGCCEGAASNCPELPPKESTLDDCSKERPDDDLSEDWEST